MTIDENQHWHLDRKVPITLIFVIIMQAVAGMAYVGRMEARFDQRIALLEADSKSQHDREVEQSKTRASEVAALVSRFDRFEQKLDRLYERDHNVRR